MLPLMVKYNQRKDMLQFDSNCKQVERIFDESYIFMRGRARPVDRVESCQTE